jgi:hypothetical protein
MKKLILSSLFACLLFSGYAQPNPQRRQPPPPPPGDEPEQFERRGPGKRMRGGPNRENKERIELFKIQFITEKLGLTTSEAEAFWPVYEAYKNVMKDILKSKSEDEILFQESILNARKKYKTDLKPVLKSEERVNEALKIEREFLNKVRGEMNKRRGFQP